MKCSGVVLVHLPGWFIFVLALVFGDCDGTTTADICQLRHVFLERFEVGSPVRKQKRVLAMGFYIPGLVCAPRGGWGQSW
jgi:hypothetical protein